MIADALTRWTVADVVQTFPLSYRGKTYAVPRQWILWRVLAHDQHHGEFPAVVLGMQGVGTIVAILALLATRPLRACFVTPRGDLTPSPY